MHICIPDTRELRPPHGSAFLLYNVHIDGLYHCSLRYKQLLHLHQALSKKFPGPQHHLAPFPPKKLLPLTTNQVEERRAQLEKYLQNISQDKAISNSSIFNLFLLEAQRESTRIENNQVHLDVELVNGQKIRLPIVTHDSADAILTTVCRALGLKDRYHAYFCLCLCGYDVVRDKLIIKRRLSFFESPYITLQMAIQQQEQLQNLFHQSTVVASDAQQLSSAAAAAATTGAPSAIINPSGCRCQSCCTTASTTGVPLVGSSSDSSANNSVNIRHPYHDHHDCHRQCSQLNHYTNNNNNNNSNYHNQNKEDSSRYFYKDFTDTTTTSSNGTLYNSSHNHYQYPCVNSNTSSSGATTTGKSFVTHRILLRKSYWDPIYDSYLLNDQQALNLLFIQTVYDIKHSLMFVDKQTYHRLESLLASESKLEYILLARQLKYYNYVHFEPCYSDYPVPGTKVMISIGSKEMNMRVLKSPKQIARAPLLPSSSSGPADCAPAHLIGGTDQVQCTQQVASSPSSLSSPSTSSSSSASSSSSTSVPVVTGGQLHHHQQQQQPQQQQPILYCTSSLVPSGYQHLIRRDDIVEEEYNFKVPLIRCWRLTSLETLNSSDSNNNLGVPQSAQGNPKQQAISSTTLAGGKRRSLSLFNSVVGNSNGIKNSPSQTMEPNKNRRMTDSAPESTGILYGNSDPRDNQHHYQQSAAQRRRSLISSGDNGASLVAAVLANGGGRGASSLFNDGSDSSGGNLLTDNHRYCQHENQRCEPMAMNQTQFSQYELSFEYLISKDTLRWVTISSDQAIFISISLQGVVDELVSKRECYNMGIQSTDISSPGARQQSQQLTPPLSASLRESNSINQQKQQQESFSYMYRDGSQKTFATNNLQFMDRLCPTLNPCSMTNGSVSVSRQRQHQQSTGFRYSNQSPYSSPSSSSTNSRLLVNQTSRVSDWFGIGSNNHSNPEMNSSGFGSFGHSASFEISSLKKVPSPIINDAFEGVTNDDDL